MAGLAVATLFILGGIFSFLPVPGIWMLPLGLLLITEDVEFLQRPLDREAVGPSTAEMAKNPEVTGGLF